MADRFKAGGVEHLMYAQERQHQLDHVIRMKSPLTKVMDNGGYKKIVELEKQRRGQLLQMKQQEIELENQRMLKRVSEVNSTTPCKLRAMIRNTSPLGKEVEKKEQPAADEPPLIPGPVSLNIGNRVAFVKRVNRENLKINNRLNSVRSVVPEADRLIADDLKTFDQYRKFASRYKMEDPNEYMKSIQGNKVYRRQEKRNKALGKLSKVVSVSRLVDYHSSSKQLLGQRSQSIQPVKNSEANEYESIMAPDTIQEIASRAAESQQKESRKDSAQTGANSRLTERKTASAKSKMVVQDGTEFKDKIEEGTYQNVSQIEDKTKSRASSGKASDLPNLQARKSSVAASQRPSIRHDSAVKSKQSSMQIHKPELKMEDLNKISHRGAGISIAAQKTTTNLEVFQKAIAEKKAAQKRGQFDLSSILDRLEATKQEPAEE